MSEGRIVLVDDEEMVTQNLEMLLSMETDYEPVSFNQPASALEYLKQNKADVVVSDFIMPEMNGLDLLAQVKEVQPTCSRLLLTGYADKESAIRAINDVGLFQYLEKPWENEFVMMTLRNAVERSRLLNQLQDRTQSLDTFREEVWKMLI
jgi:DNA-binding NtrC family response regulator